MNTHTHTQIFWSIFEHISACRDRVWSLTNVIIITLTSLWGLQVSACASVRWYECRQVSELGISLVKWQQCSGRYSGPDSIPMVGRLSVVMCRDGACLLGWGKSCRSIITSLEMEMVVKEHLDVGPPMEGSSCVMERFTEHNNQGFKWSLHKTSLLYYRAGGVITQENRSRAFRLQIEPFQNLDVDLSHLYQW